MKLADEDEMDERARVLRRKVLNNLVGAQLKNEREKERLDFKLKCLGKEEDRQLRQIHRELLQARHILNSSTIEEQRKKSGQPTTDGSKGKGKISKTFDKLKNGTYAKRPRLRGKEMQYLRQPRSFLELRRLPPLAGLSNMDEEKSETGVLTNDGRINKKTVLPEIVINQRPTTTRERLETINDRRISEQLQESLILQDLAAMDEQAYLFEDFTETIDFYPLDDRISSDPSTSISSALARAFSQERNTEEQPGRARIGAGARGRSLAQ